jgi:hypothetical protein
MTSICFNYRQMFLDLEWMPVAHVFVVLGLRQLLLLWLIVPQYWLIDGSIYFPGC